MSCLFLVVILFLVTIVILITQGWVECVGCADRSAYDLTVHSKRTKEKLVAREQLPEPRVVEQWQLEINKKVFGPKYKKQTKVVEEQLLAFSEQELESYARELEQNAKFSVTVEGETIDVTTTEVTVQKVKVTEHGECMLYSYWLLGIFFGREIFHFSTLTFTQIS